jgi:hypothetical protein
MKPAIFAEEIAKQTEAEAISAIAASEQICLSGALRFTNGKSR